MTKSTGRFKFLPGTGRYKKLRTHEYINSDSQYLNTSIDYFNERVKYLEVISIYPNYYSNYIFF